MTSVQPCKQVSVNGTLIIPNHKPDIERILRVTSTPVITKTSVICNKVVIAGHILIYIEYVACVPGNSQPVHFVSFKVPFAEFIEHPCANPELTAILKIDVEFQEFHAVSARCISQHIILKICVVRLKEKDCNIKPQPCPPPCIDPCPPPCNDPCGPPCSPYDPYHKPCHPPCDHCYQSGPPHHDNGCRKRDN